MLFHEIDDFILYSLPDLLLPCILLLFFFLSLSGVPLPSLTWYMNGEPIDDMYFSIEENKTVINQLNIFNVSRDHLKAVLMCTATNALYPSSLNATITLDLNCK